jgi:hypothetical protein
VAGALSSALNFPNALSRSDSANLKNVDKPLTFAERVGYQRAIEEVYWRHRIWSKDNGQTKPVLDKVMSHKQIETKVWQFLRKCQLLEQEKQTPITPEQLQAEMDRMARHSKSPEILRELFAALGNDPFVIAECLAKPALTQRMCAGGWVKQHSLFTGSSKNLSSYAGVQGLEEYANTFFAPADDPLKHPSVSFLSKAVSQAPMTMAAIAPITYTLPVVPNAAASTCTDDTWTATDTTNAPGVRRKHVAVWTGAEMIVWGGSITPPIEHYTNTGAIYDPATDT